MTDAGGNLTGYKLRFDWKSHHLLIVLIAGAIGAGLAYLSGLAGTVLNTPMGNDRQVVHLLLHICFGSLTAGVFIYLVANTDRTDTLRMAFLAALVGVFWNPTLMAAKALLEARGAQKEEVAAVKQEARELVQPTGLGQDKPEISKDEFNKFITDYDSLMKVLNVPAYKNEIKNDPKVIELFKSAAEQPWYKDNQADLIKKYPDVGFEFIEQK